MEHEARKWLATAQTDFDVASHLFNTFYPRPFEIICYHCQQCAEKAIKAVIISKGAPGGMPKLHDLSFLLNQLKNMVEIDERYYDYADTLTPYGVAVRYPNELFLEEHHAENALKMSEEILVWAKSLV